MDDTALLQAYIRDGSEVAFREIVSRHIALVYSAAYRQVGDPALAEDVAQVVFITLWKKAEELPRGTLLTGWLYRTTRFVAARTQRTEQRRRHREEEAVQMQITGPAGGWEELAPYLDEGMAQLGEVDRGAVLLRYFKNRSLREVGRALGISEDTAQKRVSRAVEKLRTFLWKKRRLAVSAVALTSFLSTHAAQVAPAHLASAVLAACSSGATLSTPMYALLQQALGHCVPRPIWPRLATPVSAALLLASTTFLLMQFWPRQELRVSSWSLDSKIVTHPRPSPVKPSVPVALASISPTSSPPAQVETVPGPAPALITNPIVVTWISNFPPPSLDTSTSGLAVAAMKTISPVDRRNVAASQSRSAAPAGQPPPQPYYWGQYPAVNYPNYRVGQGILFLPGVPIYTNGPRRMLVPSFVTPGQPRSRPTAPPKRT